MDDPTYTDDDLQEFFSSPAARRAGQDARRPEGGAAADDDAWRSAPLTGEDADLGTFFGSPDAPRARRGGASGDGAATAPPPGPAAPPRPTGPAADRRRRTTRALAVVCGLVVLGALGAVAVVAWLSQDLPSLEQIENPQNLLATQVLTADGQELARYYDGENRTWVSLDQMSPYVPAALIATEDRRFYDHWGMDLYGFGAVVVDALRGNGLRGASTITMQLARNLYRDQVEFTIGDRSVVRKAKEILTAVRIERTYTKDEILEAYLNTVPFLYNAYGIEAAAETFFSKPAAALSPAESATLVGMLAANSFYDPVRNPENSTRRRNVVLLNMRNQDVLDQAAYGDARADPVDVAATFNPYSHEDNVAPHFAEVLRLWFREWAVENGRDPYRDGLVIRTTIDSEMQALATAAVQEQMDGLQEVVGRGWGSASDPFGRWWGRNRQIVDEYVRGTDHFARLRAEGLDPDDAVAELRRDGEFMDSLKTARTQLEAGLIAMDPTSGRVKAWVGGRDFIANKFDHGGQARRQPGSTFKLFAYTTAFDNGYSPQSPVLDGRFAWGDWQPQNSGGSYRGWTTLAEGLQQSRNVVAARVTQHFGQAELARTAYQMGIRTPLELPPPLIDCTHNRTLRQFDVSCEAGQTFVSVPRERWERECEPFEARANDCYARSIALGTADVSLLEMVTAYATIANYGVYHGPTVEEDRPADTAVPPHIVLAVDRIEDRYGNVIEDFTPVAREVLNPSTAYTVYDAMRAVVTGGTARGLTSRFPDIRGLDLAGKTGTTQENADGWFIAMTPQLVVGSWTGFDDRRITYPNTAIGQGGRTGLLNVGAFLERLQTEGDSTVRLDPDIEFEEPADYQPPTRRGRIGTSGYLPGGSSRSRSRSRSSSGGGSRNQTAPSPAREILDRMQDRPAPAERPETGGRIGW
ncbi:transglycosylase domain-containing protein [Rubrivirga sp. S365]|uniref:Transglycosylase domain-containing protein n=1 Tax=Rubrivirga litoralis TaxID=3075598 RepID=A0ABU3BT86_9BACT|nr:MULTISPECIES: transglycosylase domain-containing protein [unclassified Rubrivirga]MDT0632505.1 transglycosylase domain-containing protein [Rubrivirga sp. F394]MDT7858005.1 transglycosylase domain-containing protein [Rubrivirga sp. S365]